MVNFIYFMYNSRGPINCSYHKKMNTALILPYIDITKSYIDVTASYTHVITPWVITADIDTITPYIDVTTPYTIQPHHISNFTTPDIDNSTELIFMPYIDIIHLLIYIRIFGMYTKCFNLLKEYYGDIIYNTVNMHSSGCHLYCCNTVSINANNTCIYTFVAVGNCTVSNES